MTTLLIKGGKVVDPANKVEHLADVLIENGKIKKVGSIKEKADETIDAKGLIVCPGLIDMHVHLREPGREDKETIATASRAAAHGGFTTIVGMPNTNPTADNQTVIEFVLSKARKEAVVNVLPVGAITVKREGHNLAEIGELKKTGAVAVSDDGADIQDANVMRRALEYCTMWKMPVISHSEDIRLSAGGAMHEGLVSTELGLPGKPAAAEEVMIAREIILSSSVGCPIHFTHVSAKGSVELIRDAKKRGCNVSADTCPHYFSLTDEAVRGYNANAKMNPPLRPKEHVAAVKEGLKDGTIDVIATDHAPHLLVDKFLEFEECESGIVGLETAVPLVISRLVDAKVLSLSDAIAKMTVNPAKVLHLDKGTLSPGADADVTIIDIETEKTVKPEEFQTKGRNTPFGGWKLGGWPVHTIVGGKIVMRDGKIKE
ncbi:MAG: dihydroorotase [Candidatus Diapherotrites archaeon]|nr:dihydroorotase [Candidatus Diapherotrites archaeon]